MYLLRQRGVYQREWNGQVTFTSSEFQLSTSLKYFLKYSIPTSPPYNPIYNQKIDYNFLRIPLNT